MYTIWNVTAMVDNVGFVIIWLRLVDVNFGGFSIGVSMDDVKLLI